MKAWTPALGHFDKKFDSHITFLSSSTTQSYNSYSFQSDLHLRVNTQSNSAFNHICSLLIIHHATRPYFERCNLRTLSFIQTPTFIQNESSATEIVQGVSLNSRSLSFSLALVVRRNILTLIQELKFGVEGRQSLLVGIDTLAKAVATTLGPKGRNVLIESSYGSPKITKGG